MRKIVGIILHRNFEKSYVRQGKNIQRAFRERADLLFADANHPLLNCHPLHGTYEGYWSMNVTGDVRAVFKVEGYFAVFVAIGTHDHLYNK